jgi:hypothetical protein
MSENTSNPLFESPDEVPAELPIDTTSKQRLAPSKELARFSLAMRIDGAPWPYLSEEAAFDAIFGTKPIETREEN